MIIGLWTRVQGWLAAAGLILGALVSAWVVGRRGGRQDAERDHLQQRVHGAQERANADADAARVPDPNAELLRDWRRGL